MPANPFRWRKHRDSKEPKRAKESKRRSLVKYIFGRQQSETASEEALTKKKTWGSKAAPASKESERKVDNTAFKQPEPQPSPVLEQKELQAVELDDDLIKSLFSGAPQFSIGIANDQNVPLVSFPLDKSLVRDSSDCVPIAHPSFSAATLHTHVLADASNNRSTIEYDIGTWEVPNMLRAQGSELGTVGFEYFLQENIPDSRGPSTEEEQIAESMFDVLENHQILETSPEKLGLRRFNLDMLGERLVELLDLYKEFRSTGGKIHLLKKSGSGELYSMLFSQILTPPKFDSSVDDPTGLKVQIEALLIVLKLEKLWFDFSNIEWRIRAGQVLWGTAVNPESVSDEEDVMDENSISDRDVLILQIILACELLLRLDAISAASAEEVKGDLNLSREDIAEFHHLETDKTRWDLILARRFLRNVHVKVTAKSAPTVVQSQRTRNLFSMLHSEPEQHSTTSKVDITFLPQDLEVQLSGLFTFARAIDWPDVAAFEEQLRSRFTAPQDPLLVSSSSVYATPLSSPRSAVSNRSSYFDSRPLVRRHSTPRSIHLSPSAAEGDFLGNHSDSGANGNGNGNSLVNSEASQTTLIGGWLTRSFVTGLVLPGEPIIHFLISSVLENDPTAIASLGDSANLYGGFAYNFRSWWSKTSIVGRVLSAVPGSKECMGWITLPLVPEGVDSGWFDVQSQSIESVDPPRIEDRSGLKQSGSITAGIAVDQLKTEDFILPEDPQERTRSIFAFASLHLKVHDVDIEDALSVGAEGLPENATISLPPQLAVIHFTPEGARASAAELNVPLLHLVTFVSAYPCFPPSSGTLKVLKPGDSESSSNLTGHPLHISQTYKIESASELLAGSPLGDERPQSPESFADAAETIQAVEEERNGQSGDDFQVLVIDARGDSSLELLARSWCSWKGEHALISRVKTTCLACSVREARALALKVIIRVDD